MEKFYGKIITVMQNGKDIFMAKCQFDKSERTVIVTSQSTKNLFGGYALKEGMVVAMEIIPKGKVFTVHNFIKSYVKSSSMDVHYDRIAGLSVADKKHSSIKDLGVLNEHVVTYTEKVTETRTKLKQQHSDLPDYMFGFTFGKALERSISKASSKTSIEEILENATKFFAFMLPSYEAPEIVIEEAPSPDNVDAFETELPA